jgi:hypothetical protein
MERCPGQNVRYQAAGLIITAVTIKMDWYGG